MSIRVESLNPKPRIRTRTESLSNAGACSEVLPELICVVNLNAKFFGLGFGVVVEMPIRAESLNPKALIHAY